MKTTYKGYELSAKREQCLGGWGMIYFSIFRISDGLECVTNFHDGDDTIPSVMRMLKERVDAEHATPDPWCEMSEGAE